MNRELYLCSLLMLAVFAGMIWYLADYVSSNQEALFNNSYNSQQRVLAQENTAERFTLGRERCWHRL